MKTCLVVDDSRVIRKVTCRILKDLGFETAEADSGEDALIACRTKIPDVILLDWNLPHLNGVEFLKSLRQGRDGSVPVVLLCTTESDPPHLREALAAGATDYVMKPFDRTILQAKFADLGLM